MKKETSCINSRAIINYVKEYNNGDCSCLFGDLDPEIDALPDPEKYLTDPNNWISCTVITKLYERARLLFNDEKTALKIAKHTIINNSLGYAQRIIVKSIWSYKNSLKNLQKVNDKWNRNKKVEVSLTGKNEAIVRLHWLPGMDIKKDICLYNQGAYIYMPLIWHGRPTTLHESRCYFEGDKFCEYHLKWPARNRLNEIFSRFSTSKSVLVDTIKEMDKDKKIIEEKYEEVNRLNVELNTKVRQLVAVQETGKAILSVLDLDQLLTIIMNILSNVCRINKAIIMFMNQDTHCLEYMHALGFGDEIPEEVKKYTISINRVSNILARVASTGRSEYVPNVNESTLKKDNILLSRGKPSSVFVLPLITRSKVIGVIATDAVDQNGVPKETRETLRTFGPQIAIAIENARLYSRLQEQMQELKQSHALLSRAEKFSFLGNLAARLAHEIKNPMTAIGTFIQMLPQKYDDEEFRKEFQEIAMEETNRVNDLITELLDLVKTKESRFESNNLHNLIEKMVLLVSPQTKSKNILVSRQFDPQIDLVKMDAEKMKQVILNLLSNAIEFTPQRGKIEIVTKSSSNNKSSGYVQIQIKDNGAGIPESMINKIFDPYFTTKHKSSMHSGTGLGLFIAHQNMEDHGGTIEVKSKVDEGTTFILNLPVEPSA